MPKNEIKVGPPGSGKSKQEEFAVVTEYEDGRPYAVVHLDSKRDGPFEMASQLVAGGLERFVEYEPLAATDGKCLAWDWLPESTLSDPIQKAAEEELIREEHGQIWAGQKGIVSYESAPYTREAMHLAIDTMQAQQPRKALPWMKNVLLPATAEWLILLQDCQKQSVRERLQASARMWSRSPTFYEQWAGSARRMLDPLDSPVVQARCNPEPGKEFNWYQAFKDRKYIGVSGAGVARPTYRTVALAMILQAIHCCRRHHAQFREELPVLVILEEAGANRLVVPFVQTAMQEGRASGIGFHILTQSLQDLG